MALLETLFGAITTKAAVGAATAALAAGGVVAMATSGPERGQEQRSEVATNQAENDGQDDLIEIPRPVSEDVDVSTQDDEDDGDRRSEVARAVHEAKTGGAAVPGDEDFGRIVSENAREGGLGEVVSEAARNAARERQERRAEERGGDEPDVLSDDDAPGPGKGKGHGRGNGGGPPEDRPGRG